MSFIFNAYNAELARERLKVCIAAGLPDAKALSRASGKSVETCERYLSGYRCHSEVTLRAIEEAIYVRQFQVIKRWSGPSIYGGDCGICGTDVTDCAIVRIRFNDGREPIAHARCVGE